LPIGEYRLRRKRTVKETILTLKEKEMLKEQIETCKYYVGE